MDEDDEQLVREFKGLISSSGYRAAFGDESTDGTDAGSDATDAPDDFFSALSAFRAARASGDKQAEAAAEDHLREVVRAELTGE